jgi:DNA replication protein DnaC
VGYILNHRYNEDRVTIVTTNYLDDGGRRDARKGVADCLTDRIGDRMRSRLYEMCKTIPMEGSDFRQSVKHANHRY